MRSASAPSKPGGPRRTAQADNSLINSLLREAVGAAEDSEWRSLPETCASPAATTLRRIRENSLFFCHKQEMGWFRNGERLPADCVHRHRPQSLCSDIPDLNQGAEFPRHCGLEPPAPAESRDPFRQCLRKVGARPPPVRDLVEFPCCRGVTGYFWLFRRCQERPGDPGSPRRGINCSRIKSSRAPARCGGWEDQAHLIGLGQPNEASAFLRARSVRHADAVLAMSALRMVTRHRPGRRRRLTP